MHGYLLPFKVKWIGAALVLLGLAMSVCYLWFDFRLIVPVFAVYSSFLETKTLAMVRTNIADELIMLSFLCGFLLLAFSKEKHERETLDHLRTRALVKAVLANTAFLLFAILFIYGNGFLTILLANLVTLFLFYLVFFQHAKWRHGV